MSDEQEIDPEAAARYADNVGQFEIKMRLGASVYPLPRTLAELRRKLDALYVPFLEASPEHIDEGFRLEFAQGGEIRIAEPVHGVKRSRSPGRFVLHAPPGEAQRAANLLADGLDLMERHWLARKRATWMALRTAERTASQLLLMHLVKCAPLAEAAEKRYVGNPENDRLRIDLYGPEFDSLRQAVVEVAKAREDADLDLLRKQKDVLQAAALGAMALSLLHVEKVAGGVKAAFTEVEGLASDAAIRAARANIEYLAKVRELAKKHPVLIALQHHTEGMRRKGKRKSYTIASLQGDIRDAIANARKAIVGLREVAMTPVVPYMGEDADAEPMEVVPLIEAVQKARVTTVWRLPFFMDRALEHLLPAARREVLAVREDAEEKSREEAFSELFKLVGCEAMAALAPLAGPVGVAVAVGWSLICLNKSVQEYSEVKLLYDASIDPSILLLGEEHDPADPSAVVMDLVGVITV